MKNEDYPYENAKGTCRTDRNKIVVRVTGGNQIDVNEDGLADALANYGQLSVCKTFLILPRYGGFTRAFSSLWNAANQRFHHKQAAQNFNCV